MDSVSLEFEARSRLFKLLVPGLSENRPSVMRGDTIYVRNTQATDIEYEGTVEEVREDSVMVRFSHRLSNNWVKGMKFNIRFTIGR